MLSNSFQGAVLHYIVFDKQCDIASHLKRTPFLRVLGRQDESTSQA